MRKRILLFALIVITITCLAAVTVSATTYTGTCGDNLTWSLDTDTGVLEIKGTGAMDNWTCSDYVPWRHYRDYVKSVKIGNGVTTIGNYAFQYCIAMRSVDIPDSVFKIGEVSFYGCRLLNGVELSDSILAIGEYAFSCCYALTSINIPDTVRVIGDYAFALCDGLTSITVDKSNENYSSDDYGVLFDKDKKTLMQYPSGNNRTSYTVPAGVMTIGDYSFAASNLTSVVLPYGVTFIKDYAFFSAVNMRSITIPSSVTSIGTDVFRACSNFTVYGKTGSYAQTYANSNGILFVVQEVVPGDVNADGKVDRKDLTRLAQYFARWDVEVDNTAADTNGDGKLDRKDLTRLAQYFARWDVELG